MAQRGHDVTVVTTVPHYGLDAAATGYRGRVIYEEQWEGVRVLRTAVYVPKRKNLLSRLANFLSFALLAIPAGLRARRPDVVMGVLPPTTTGPSVWLVSRLRGVPYVLNIQDVYPDAVFKRPALGRLNRLVERFVLRGAAGIVTLSEGLKGEIARRVGVAPQTTVVPMWTDLDGVRPGPRQNAFRARHAPGAELVALYAGNLGELSGVGVILDAAAVLRDDPRVRFLIVGRGNAHAALVARAATLNLTNLTFLPTQPREGLAEMLAAADVGLVTLDPRLSETNVPSKTFTIMAAARPVLAAIDERNEIARVVRAADCGVVVPPHGAEQIANALRAWIGSPHAAEAGHRGRDWAERHHTRSAAVDGIEKTLTEAAQRR